MKARITEKEIPVKSYRERQAEWVKTNNVKVGTKVKIVRENTEKGWAALGQVGTNKYIGKTYTIKTIYDTNISISEMWLVPYTMLEIIEEPKFQSFTLEIEVNSEDELKELYHRFRIGNSAIKNNMGTSRIDYPKGNHGHDTLNTLGSKCGELNLTKPMNFIVPEWVSNPYYPHYTHYTDLTYNII